jgi:hypothetical protein
MCLPTNTEISASGFRSTLGLGALMLVACLAGPVLAGVIGALGVGVLLGVGGAVVPLALCAVVPTVAIAARRRSSRRQPKPQV